MPEKRSGMHVRDIFWRGIRRRLPARGSTAAPAAASKFARASAPWRSLPIPPPFLLLTLSFTQWLVSLAYSVYQCCPPGGAPPLPWAPWPALMCVAGWRKPAARVLLRSPPLSGAAPPSPRALLAEHCNQLCLLAAVSPPRAPPSSAAADRVAHPPPPSFPLPPRSQAVVDLLRPDPKKQKLVHKKKRLVQVRVWLGWGRSGGACGAAPPLPLPGPLHPLTPPPPPRRPSPTPSPPTLFSWTCVAKRASRLRWCFPTPPPRWCARRARSSCAAPAAGRRGWLTAARSVARSNRVCAFLQAN